MKKLLFTRKFNKETYKFYENDSITWVAFEKNIYYTVETPKNCFGYNDYILFDKTYKQPYTLHRYLQPWIIKACEKAFLKKGYNIYG